MESPGKGTWDSCLRATGQGGSGGGGGCACGCPVKKKRTKKKKKPTRRCHTHPPSQPQKRLTTWDSKSETVLGPPAGADPPQEPGPASSPASYLPEPSRAPCVAPSSAAHASFPTPGLTLPQQTFAPSPPGRRRLSSLDDIPLQTRASFLPASPPSPHTHTHRHTQTHTHAHRPSPQTTTLTVSQPGPKTAPTAEAERSRFAAGAVRRLERG